MMLFESILREEQIQRPQRHQEVADIIWRAMAGEGKDAVRQ